MNIETNLDELPLGSPTPVEVLVPVPTLTESPLLPDSSRVRKPKSSEQKTKDAAAKKAKRLADLKATAPVKVKKEKKVKAKKAGRGRPPGSKNKPKVGKPEKPAKAKKVRLGVKADNDKVAIVTYVNASLQKKIAGAAKSCNMAVARWTRDILAGQF